MNGTQFGAMLRKTFGTCGLVEAARVPGVVENSVKTDVMEGLEPVKYGKSGECLALKCRMWVQVEFVVDLNDKFFKGITE